MDASLNLSKLAKYFSDETAARELLESMRWPNGWECPTCGQGAPTVYRMQPMKGSKKPGRPGLLRCRACKKQFTVTVGTIFEDSHIPLSKWLLAIHLLCASKKGMSAHQLMRMLGLGSYRSAWFMAHRLRYAMSQEPLASKLSGVVEVDETYVGARRSGGKRGRGAPNKAAVVALVERGGRVRAFPVQRVTGENLVGAMREHVDQQARIMTDELNVYNHVGEHFASHDTVLHGAGEYVRGDVHTNSVEGFFSLLKRGIIGVYHHVGKGHLGRYCDEFAYRYDLRKEADGTRAEMLVRQAEGKRLTYRPLKESLDSLLD